MLESLDRNFGLLIAFVLPGFLFLVGLVELADQFSIDLPPQLVGSQQLGDFLYFLLASTAAGVGLSGLRWVIVDRLLHATGLEPPALNFQKLEAKHASFMLVVENNYRFYLFYSNCLVALLLLGGIAPAHGARPSVLSWLVYVLLVLTLGLASRDSLGRFYARSRQIMGEISQPKQRSKRRKR